ncbi:MAG TPA: hypothetical protein VG839_01050 [Asticcacaulis sp.]|nr:hypothetical protein [Asticcacaulis sp.]
MRNAKALNNAMKFSTIVTCGTVFGGLPLFNEVVFIGTSLSSDLAHNLEKEALFVLLITAWTLAAEALAQFTLKTPPGAPEDGSALKLAKTAVCAILYAAAFGAAAGTWAIFRWQAVGQDLPGFGSALIEIFPCSIMMFATTQIVSSILKQLTSRSKASLP